MSGKTAAAGGGIAAKCVMRQLKQLAKAPLQNCSAGPCGDDLFEIHCTVVGPEGTAYEGVKLHFVLELSESYPVEAPKAYFVTEIQYQGGASMKDAQGRTQVCLNLFGNFANYHTEWATESAGWSSGYSLETVLVQMQSVLHDTFLSTDAGAVERTRRSAAGGRCRCGHTDASPYPELSGGEGCDGGSAAAAAAAAEARRGEPVCYATGAALEEEGTVLGIGLVVERGHITSPAEVLSQEAFQGGVRRSSDNGTGFDHFLPLSFSGRHHARAKAALRSAVDGVVKALGREDVSALPIVPRVAVVCGLVMTALVVEVNKRAGGAASDHFIDTYYRILHTLLTVDAEAGGAVGRYVQEKVVGPFVRDAGWRSKTHTPNLGLLMALLPLGRCEWADVAGPLVEESSARNVFWVVEGPRAQPGPHRELADPAHGTDAERCAKMFASTPVSRKLMCFQRVFLDAAKELDRVALEATWGCVDAATKERIKRAHADVARMTTWDEHYDYLGVSFRGNGKGDAFHARRLREALARSQELGYHGRTGKGKGKGKGGAGKGRGGKGGYNGNKGGR